MKRKLLAVRPKATNYLPNYVVDTVPTYAQAMVKIEAAEAEGVPYDSLDLPVEDASAFWAFLDWMEARGRKYAFSVYGCISDTEFWEIAEKTRARGFRFNS